MIPKADKREEALDKVSKFYSATLRTHGLVPQSVGWKDEASQLLRFQKLARVLDRTDGTTQAISVNDFGCGYGAMFRYLDEIPSIQLTQYYGYDISEEMLAAAKESVSDPRAEFICAPLVTYEADYSFVSGTFNVKLEASDEIWAEYVKEALINLAAMARRGIAFNALTTYVDWKEEHLYYADPFFFLDFCKRYISRYVCLLHDYPLFEWTVIVYKKDETT